MPAACLPAGWESRRGSNYANAGALEHLGERDERQADQRGGILGLDARDEGDAEAFGLGAAGAVVGLFLLQVALDARVVELTEMHAARNDARLHAAAPPIEEGKRGVEVGAFPAEG